MANAVVVNAIMLSVITLSTILLSVVAPNLQACLVFIYLKNKMLRLLHPRLDAILDKKI
jgi:hypothetical protein